MSVSSDECREPSPKRRRKAGLDWTKLTSYESYEKAHKSLKEEKTWEMRRRYTTADGEKVHYDCRYSKDCRAKKFILLVNDSQRCDIYHTTPTHTHAKPQPRGIPNPTKQKIRELYQSGVTKPKTILRKIRDSGLPEPTGIQLANFLTSVRAVEDDEPKVSLSQLEKCLKNDSSIPEDDDEPFVLKYDAHFDDDAERRYFRFCYTTKRLQSIKNKCPTLQTDSTHKLLWQGFPVLISGCSDSNRTFHPTCIGVFKSEAAEDFKFFFNALSESYKPKALLADCGDDVTNSCFNVFGKDVARIYCWNDVIRSVDKKICLIVDAKLRTEIRSDILALQLARSDGEFDVTKELFLEKWRALENVCEFLEFFEEEYLNRFVGWHVGRK